MWEASQARDVRCDNVCPSDIKIIGDATGASQAEVRPTPDRISMVSAEQMKSM